jgi:exosortase
LLIPFVVLALFWWKRKELLSLPLRTWWPGLFLVAGGLMLHVVGYSVQQPRISILGLFLGLYGLMGLAWGPELLRRSIFPFFLFLFCMPLSTLIEALSVPLQILVCRIVEWVAQNLLGIDVVRAGTQLYDPTGRYRYEIVAACSGIRSLVSIGVMATLAGFLFLPKWWQRLFLMASAVPLAIAGNVLRLVTIIISGEIWGQQGGDYVHEGGPLGIISMLPYVPAFFGLFAAAKWLRKREDSAPKPI